MRFYSIFSAASATGEFEKVAQGEGEEERGEGRGERGEGRGERGKALALLYILSPHHVQGGGRRKGGEGKGRGGGGVLHYSTSSTQVSLRTTSTSGSETLA